MRLRSFMMLLVLFALARPGFAAIDAYEFSTPDRQQRFAVLTEELRCPKCQNQNIADSNSPIATDLRREIYRMLEEGKNDEQIVGFLVDRYGEFVLYKPRFSSKTIVLWGGPLLFLLIGLVVLFGLLRKNSKEESSVAVKDTGSQPRDALTVEEQQRLKDLLG